MSGINIAIVKILGFSPSGQPVVPTTHHTAAAAAKEEESGFVASSASSTARREKLSWDEICKRSTKVLSFIDLAGHERYLKVRVVSI